MIPRPLFHFRFFGFDVRVHKSWIFIGILLIWTLAKSVFPSMAPGLEEDTYWRMGGIGLMLIILSILAHEVAHAVVAQRYGMPIVGITLFVFGGVAEMQGPPSHPKGEFLMAIAGPIMSALMGIFFWANGVFYEKIFLTDAPSTVTAMLAYLGHINILLAVFNMVPAFPLDGGRALRAALWHFKGSLVRATRIATEGGTAFAYGLIAWGLYLILHENFVPGIWWGLLGFFVHAAGEYALNETESRSLLSGKPVIDFMRKNPVAVSPDTSIASLVDDYIYSYYHKNFPVVDQNRLVGIVSLDSVLMIDRKRWQWLRVSTVMEPVSTENTVAPDMDAAQALELMRKTGKRRLLVTSDKDLVGILSMRDMLDYLSITLKLDNSRELLERLG